MKKLILTLIAIATLAASPAPFAPPLPPITTLTPTAPQVLLSWEYSTNDLPDVVFVVASSPTLDATSQWTQVLRVTNALQCVLPATESKLFYQVIVYSPFYGTSSPPSPTVILPALPRPATSTSLKKL